MYIDELKFDDSGLIPAVICDHKTNEVLMVGYMNQQALQETIQTGRTTFWSRSRQRLWRKGESSGHIQQVKWVRADCDADCLLIGVEQRVAACHLGYRSCFFRELRDGKWEVVAEKVFDPDEAYSQAE
ncbi:MAG: phosphoribosyl-AMP cyclohydrolase [Armatimonadetes bacterium]|nr:phosphoribosyl-AMP cyclohydrolase [Armatimonadota bacterium]